MPAIDLGTAMGLSLAARRIATTAATTLNPLDKAAGLILTNGNLTATGDGAAGYENVRSTTSRSSGKYYFEGTCVAAANGAALGIADAAGNLVSYLGSDAHSMGWYGSGFGGPSPFIVGDVLGVAVDLTARLLWYSRNGVFTGSPAAGTGGTAITVNTATSAFFGADTASTGSMTANFNPSSPPAGFAAWG